MVKDLPTEQLKHLAQGTGAPYSWNFYQKNNKFFKCCLYKKAAHEPKEPYYEVQIQFWH
jgi:hypothetical protein